MLPASAATDGNANAIRDSAVFTFPFCASAPKSNHGEDEQCGCNGDILPRSALEAQQRPKSTRELPSLARRSHEFPRGLGAEHHALPHGAIIYGSGSYFFVFDMSFLVLKMKTHVSY